MTVRVPFVVDSIYLPLSEKLIIQGKAGANLLKNTNVSALHTDFIVIGLQL